MGIQFFHYKAELIYLAVIVYNPFLLIIFTQVKVDIRYIK